MLMTKKSLGVGALIVGAGLLLSACSGAETPEPSSTPDTSAPAATTNLTVWVDAERADALSGAELPTLAGLTETAGLENEAELNRAQIREVLRARRLGRSVAIRVAGGRDLRVKRPREIKS